MKNRTYKVIAGIVAAIFIAIVVIPLIIPGHADAKWLAWPWHKTNKVPAQANFNESQTEMEPEQGTEAVVISGKDGVTKYINVVQNEGTAIEIVIDTQDAQELQKTADQGHQPWLLDPVQVVQRNAAKYGFDEANDTFTLAYQTNKGKSGAGEARVLVEHGAKYYVVELIQPGGHGAHKIWQVKSVREVKVTVKQSPRVTPGVDGLDYDKVVKWQQNVDAGQELWRLDPLQVARIEGKRYGFSANDAYEIVKRLSSSSLAPHGEIHIKVVHADKEYTMVLVRPLGSDRGAIWTTHHVTSKDVKPEPTPSPQPTKKVLFATDSFEGWKWWYHTAYPKDSSFAAITDYDTWLKTDKRIPEHVLEKAKNVDYSNKVVLFAYLGTAPSGGYGIGIENVIMEGNNITVTVRTKSPAPNEMVTKAITFPADFVTLDRHVVDMWGGVNVTFVDQKGNVLSKNKLVISHR